MAHTSWHKVGNWYSDIVGTKGHHYHESVIFPAIKSWLPHTENQKLLDLACGNGVLARILPEKVQYRGYDLAGSLIQDAVKLQTPIQKNTQSFDKADATKPLAELSGDNSTTGTYTHAACILALQNMENGEGCIRNISTALIKGGQGIIVMNHPCFRIPRQSSWETDPKNKLQYRRINRYASDLEIPITAHPGQKNSQVTWSYHHPLHIYFSWFSQNGLAVTDLLELTSDKESVGKNAKAENRGRSEFPLFLALRVVKL